MEDLIVFKNEFAIIVLLNLNLSGFFKNSVRCLYNIDFSICRLQSRCKFRNGSAYGIDYSYQLANWFKYFFKYMLLLVSKRFVVNGHIMLWVGLVVFNNI